MCCTVAERNNIYDPESKNFITVDGVEKVREWAPECKGGQICYEIAIENEREGEGFQIIINAPSQDSVFHENTALIQGSISNFGILDSLTVKNQLYNFNIPVNPADGQWSWSANLGLGSNTFIFTASFIIDQAKHDRIDTLVLFYEFIPSDLEGPVIAVTFPDENTVDTAQITLSGIASDPSGVAYVTVNGTPVQLTDNSWSYAASLTVGPNIFTIIAEDNSENRNLNTLNDTIIFISTDPTANDHTPPVITILDYGQGDVLTDSIVTIRAKVKDSNGVDSVKIWDNSNPEGDIMTLVDGDSIFAKQDYRLEVGVNTFWISAQDTSINDNKDTIEWMLIRDLPDYEGPELTLISPEDGAIIPTDTVTITVRAVDVNGIGSGGVTINGQGMEIAGIDQYSITVTLLAGPNSFIVSAYDSRANHAELKFTLFR
jgi:hypothetical protein